MRHRRARRLSHRPSPRVCALSQAVVKRRESIGQRLVFGYRRLHAPAAHCRSGSRLLIVPSARYPHQDYCRTRWASADSGCGPPPSRPMTQSTGLGTHRERRGCPFTSRRKTRWRSERELRLPAAMHEDEAESAAAQAAQSDISCLSPGLPRVGLSFLCATWQCNLSRVTQRSHTVGGPCRTRAAGMNDHQPLRSPVNDILP